MAFFGGEIERNGLSNTFTKYVFSEEAGKSRMLDRFLSGIVHPVIHFGHAPEFGMEGMGIKGFCMRLPSSTDKKLNICTGLAQIAVHKPSFEVVLDSLFSTQSGTPRTDSFSLLSRVIKDDRLKADNVFKPQTVAGDGYTEVVKNVGEILGRDYGLLWTIGEDQEDIQKCVEELGWFVTLIFGLGGWEKGRDFKASFFLLVQYRDSSTGAW
jgi:hypothetical protein